MSSRGCCLSAWSSCVLQVQGGHGGAAGAHGQRQRRLYHVPVEPLHQQAARGAHDGARADGEPGGRGSCLLVDMVGSMGGGVAHQMPPRSVQAKERYTHLWIAL